MSQKRGGKNISGPNLENHSCFGGHLIVAPLMHQLFHSRQLTLIKNTLYYLTDHIKIREV